LFVDIVHGPFSSGAAPSSAFGAHNFDAASRRRQVGVGGGVGIADLDVTTADIVIFMRRQRRRCGGRLCLFERALRRWLF
jgi:hypothetical protein